MMIRLSATLLSMLLLSGCSASPSSSASLEAPPHATAAASVTSTITPSPTSTPFSTPTPTVVQPITVPELPVQDAEPAPPADDQLVDVTPQLLTLNIAGYGTQAEIDACIGWIIFTPYEGFDVQPTIAEHNNCGGAAILMLPIGTQLRLAGGGLDGLYEIVDSRDVPQNGTTLDIQGISGEVLAQSCYFNSAYMRFIGLHRVG
jgi:hypothetical protein